jgi:pyruvate-formate lyase
MLNFTLTITAAPELLAAISSITNAISNTRVVANPQSNSTFADGKSALEPIAAPVNPVQIQQQTPTQTPLNQVSAVPTSIQTYTMEQLAVAATQLVDAGRRTDLIGLLQSFGVQALTALPKEQYGAFSTKLRTLGAKI